MRLFQKLWASLREEAGRSPAGPAWGSGGDGGRAVGFRGRAPLGPTQAAWSPEPEPTAPPLPRPWPLSLPSGPVQPPQSRSFKNIR